MKKKKDTEVLDDIRSELSEDSKAKHDRKEKDNA